MALSCDEFRSVLAGWFGSEIECQPGANDSVIVTLPLLKPNGDAIEIGIAPLGARFRLSDLGDTHSTLSLADVDMSEGSVRAAEFQQIVSAHGVTNSEQELSCDADAGNVAERTFDFVHAVQSILALQLTVVRKPSRRDFPSLVAKLLAENRASFEVPPDYVEGKTGRWKFNFVLNHVSAETLVKAISPSSASQAIKLAEESVFEIRDVREIREAKAVVIADDERQRESYWGPGARRIFEGYEIPLIQFHRNRQELINLAMTYAR